MTQKEALWLMNLERQQEKNEAKNLFFLLNCPFYFALGIQQLLKRVACFHFYALIRK